MLEPMICYPDVVEYDRADDVYNVSFLVGDNVVPIEPEAP